MLSVSNTPFMLCVVMRNVIMLSVLALPRKVQITVIHVLTVTLYHCKHDLRFNQGTLTEGDGPLLLTSYLNIVSLRKSADLNKLIQKGHTTVLIFPFSNDFLI
jgi:hypothetical protein